MMSEPIRIGVTGEPDDLLPRLPERSGDHLLQWEVNPVLRFERLPLSLAHRERIRQAPFDWILFPSPRSVTFWTETLVEHGLDHPIETQVAAMGKRTAELCAFDGYTPDFLPTSTGSEGFLADFVAMTGDGKGKTILIPSAEEGRLLVEQELKDRGWQVLRLPLYRSLGRDTIAPFDSSVVVFTSPSSAKAFFAKQNLSEDQTVACLGDYTHSFLKTQRIDAKMIRNADYKNVGEILC